MLNTNINIPLSEFLNKTTNRPNQEWMLWLMNPNFIQTTFANALGVTSGGTGLSTIPANGQLLIGNGTGYALNTLGAGAGISITNGAGTIKISATGTIAVTITAVDYTILITDAIIQATAAAATMTLPTAVGNLGKVFSINNASIGSITVNTTAGQFINGVLAQSLPANSTMQVYSDSIGWHIT